MLSFTEFIKAKPVLNSHEILTPTIFKPNKDATISKGSTILLQCFFNDKVNCAWVRRGILVNLGERYKYEVENGVDTKDCTLMINNFNPDMDFGEWKCESLGDDNTVSKTGSLVQLSIRKTENPSTTTPDHITTEHVSESNNRTFSTNHVAVQRTTSIALYVLLPTCIIIIGILVAVIVYHKNQIKKTPTSAAETQGEEMVPLSTSTR